MTPEIVPELLDRLFTNGAGKAAERLVLTSKDGRDLGWLSRQTVQQQIHWAIGEGWRRSIEANRGDTP